MQEQLGQHASVPSTYTARVDNSGRIVIPSPLRDRLHFQVGDELVIREISGSLSVSSYDRVLADAQAYFAGLAPVDVSMVDELLAERRKEATRERAKDAASDA